jgi:hypothetical protein
MSLSIVLLFIALGLTIASAANKVPLWAAVFTIVIALLVMFWSA